MNFLFLIITLYGTHLFYKPTVVILICRVFFNERIAKDIRNRKITNTYIDLPGIGICSGTCLKIRKGSVTSKKFYVVTRSWLSGYVNLQAR